MKTEEFDLSEKKFPKETWKDRARESNTLENKRIANQVFDLSEKINKNAMSVIDGDYVIMVKDVKEFIRVLKSKLIIADTKDLGSLIDQKVWIINELAGERLI